MSEKARRAYEFVCSVRAPNGVKREGGVYGSAAAWKARGMQCARRSG